MTYTPESDKAKIAFTLLFANDDAYLIPYTVGMKLERERDEARDQRDSLADALQKLADCDWVITPHDRMDAVREIARKALQSLTTNAKVSDSPS